METVIIKTEAEGEPAIACGAVWQSRFFWLLFF